MNLKLTDQEQRFSVEVEEFLDVFWPAEWRVAAMPGPRRQQAEQRYIEELVRRGWLTGHWATAHGGLGWNQRMGWILDQASATAMAPQGPVQGPKLVGPLIMGVGSADQCAGLLPAISQDQCRWAQALDEDSTCVAAELVEATIRPADTSAQWSLNGGKSWVLDGELDGKQSLWLCLLARLEHSNDLVVVLIDAARQGVTLQPRSMIGDSPGQPAVQQATFDDVRLGGDALLGEIGRGGELWQQLQAREWALAGATGRNAVLLATLRDWAESGAEHSADLWGDEDFRADLHAAEIELASLRALEQRALSAPESVADSSADFRPDFKMAASLGLAAKGAELGQRLADLQVSALGYFALPFVDFSALDNEGSIGPEFAQPALLGMLSDRARRAIGVSGEHLKNVIAKSVLALPEDDLLREAERAPDQ